MGMSMLKDGTDSLPSASFSIPLTIEYDSLALLHWLESISVLEHNMWNATHVRYCAREFAPSMNPDPLSASPTSSTSKLASLACES